MKNINIWLGSYLTQSVKKAFRLQTRKPVHIMFCIADHFEPKWARPCRDVESARIIKWLESYRKVAIKHRDSEGYHPRHTFFFPQEEYEKKHLDRLASFCDEGFGEVEIHIHHDNDTPEGLRQKIEEYKIKLSSHGLLSKDTNGNIRYGFVHGNWALDNSRRDGKWCGVNNEIEVLRDSGCYADFTLPSAPSETQTRKINSIYYAKDTPLPKSHNTGIDVSVGRNNEDGLMIIQGPLALNWKKREFGILPRIENGELTFMNPPTRYRMDLWIKQAISVKGKENWIFVKVHTHGAKEVHLCDEYFEKLNFMYSYLEDKYNDRVRYKLYYVTAREMYNIVKAAEAGEKGNPGKYRNYLLSKITTYQKEISCEKS